MHRSSAVPTPADGAAGRIKAKPSAKVQFASMVLMLEAFVVFFATLVVHGLAATSTVFPPERTPSRTTIWLVGGALMLVLVILSRLLNVPGGYVAGTLVQVPVLVVGVVVPLMYLVGGVFVVLWIVALRLGGRVDRERAAYDAAHPETAPNPSGQHDQRSADGSPRP